MSYIQFDNEGVALSAVKKAQDGRGYIIRCYNTTGSALESGFTFFKTLKSAAVVNLNEEKLSDLAAQGGSVRFTLAPYQIITVLIETE